MTDVPKVPQEVVDRVAARIQKRDRVTADEAARRARAWADQKDKVSDEQHARMEARAAGALKALAEQNAAIAAGKCVCPSPRCKHPDCLARFKAGALRRQRRYYGAHG